MKNNSDKDKSLVKITFTLFDADGNQVGTAFDLINNFKAGGTWKFNAASFEKDIASYELEDISGY